VQLSSWLRSSSLILLSKFAIFKKSQRDSYIELLEKKVKQKMHRRRTRPSIGSDEAFVRMEFEARLRHPKGAARRMNECEEQPDIAVDGHFDAHARALPLSIHTAFALSSSKRILLEQFRSHDDSRPPSRS
jgi:hypothetical protein